MLIVLSSPPFRRHEIGKTRWKGASLTFLMHGSYIGAPHRNPLMYLVEGLRFLVTLRLWLAQASGLMEYGAYARAENSRVMGLLVVVTSVITIAAALMAIAAD
jgi:hypothetical protein